MIIRLYRTVLYYVTDFVAHSELHIRVGYYAPVNMSSVCFRAMRYNFISRYTVNCTCFVQILLMTQLYNIWRSTVTMRVKWGPISYLVVVGVGTHYRLDGSGFEPRLGASDLFLHTRPALPSGYDMIYLTAIGLPPVGSSTVHIYTQTIHTRTTQSTQTIYRTTQFTN
jgi:hypothetical protein